jgi:hypothetical protein
MGCRLLSWKILWTCFIMLFFIHMFSIRTDHRPKCPVIFLVLQAMDRRYTPSHSQLSKLFIYYTLPFPHCEYQQCIKYKPGSNSTINDKVLSWKILWTCFIMLFFIHMFSIRTDHRPKCPFQTIFVVDVRKVTHFNLTIFVVDVRKVTKFNVTIFVVDVRKLCYLTYIHIKDCNIKLCYLTYVHNKDCNIKLCYLILLFLWWMYVR